MCVPSSIAKVSGGLAQWREVDVPKYGCEEHAWLHGGPTHDECKCPFGATGETRWVKEAWASIGYGRRYGVEVVYQSDNTDFPRQRGHQIDADIPTFGQFFRPMELTKWSAHRMPSWASRFRVALTVSCRQIKSVTDFEAFTSGAPSEAGRITGPYCMSYVQGLRSIIESRNPGSWERGDWFWAIECKEEK